MISQEIRGRLLKLSLDTQHFSRGERAIIQVDIDQATLAIMEVIKKGCEEYDKHYEKYPESEYEGQSVYNFLTRP